MLPPRLPLEGQCRCGAVRIRINAPPLMTAVCHCTGCQAMSSSAFSLTAMLPVDAFEVVAGEPVVGGLHDPTQAHYGCARCLSWMFTRIQGAPFVNVRPTMLEDASWFVPWLETMTSEALPWVSIPATRSYARFPDMSEFPALLQAFAADAALA